MSERDVEDVDARMTSVAVEAALRERARREAEDQPPSLRAEAHAGLVAALASDPETVAAARRAAVRRLGVRTDGTGELGDRGPDAPLRSPPPTLVFGGYHYEVSVPAEQVHPDWRGEAVPVEAVPTEERLGGFFVGVVCTHPECGAVEVMAHSEAPGQDFTWGGESLWEQGRAHAYIDTGWIYLPDGWLLQDGGGPLCPEHVGEARP